MRLEGPRSSITRGRDGRPQAWVTKPPGRRSDGDFRTSTSPPAAPTRPRPSPSGTVVPRARSPPRRYAFGTCGPPGSTIAMRGCRRNRAGLGRGLHRLPERTRIGRGVQQLRVLCWVRPTISCTRSRNVTPKVTSLSILHLLPLQKTPELDHISLGPCGNSEGDGAALHSGEHPQRRASVPPQLKRDSHHRPLRSGIWRARAPKAPPIVHCRAGGRAPAAPLGRQGSDLEALRRERPST